MPGKIFPSFLKLCLGWVEIVVNVFTASEMPGRVQPSKQKLQKGLPTCIDICLAVLEAPEMTRTLYVGTNYCKSIIYLCIGWIVDSG